MGKIDRTFFRLDRVIDLSQNIDRRSMDMAASGFTGCVAPSGMPFCMVLGRPLERYSWLSRSSSRSLQFRCACSPFRKAFIPRSSAQLVRRCSRRMPQHHRPGVLRSKVPTRRMEISQEYGEIWGVQVDELLNLFPEPVKF